MSADRHGTDLEVPVAPGEALTVSPTGDLRLVSGRANVAQALKGRALALPGHLVHRPAYGGGLPAWVEELDQATARARRASELRRQLLRDPRLQDAAVRVSPGPRASVTVVALDASLRDTEEGRLTLALEA